MSKGTFKSYLNSSLFVEDKKKEKRDKREPKLHEEIHSDNEAKETGVQHPEAQLLQGEIIIGQAHTVLKFDAYGGLNKGISGSLYCTNFKISFVSANRPTHHLIEMDRKNMIFKENDIPLTCVDAIYQVSKSKRKQLVLGDCISKNMKMVEIKCKNFKVHTFSFKFTAKSQAKTLMNTILHYAYITSPLRLFAFSFELPSLSSSPLKPAKFSSDDLKVRFGSSDWKKKNGKPKLMATYRPTSQRISSVPNIPDLPERTEPHERAGKTPQYRRFDDWQAEIQRTGAKHLRVAAINQDFIISDSLPEYFVVPSVLSDGDLQKAATHFEGGRVPTWCWSHSNGSILMRAVPLHSDTYHLDEEVRMLESITLIHPSKAQPEVMDLGRLCPSVKDIQTSYHKLHELCMPETLSDFWSTDKDWLGSVDSSKWLQYISMCMSTAVTAATTISQDRQTVILREPVGRDTSCIVASLVQIYLDPFCRTQLGFQSLIQREWVISGHPFLDRCGHVTPNDGEEAPTFLLFLDCVSQLMRQFPSTFEFTDTYLMTIWDSMFAGIFGTFLFNSERQRNRTCFTEPNETIRLATVWAWTLQYTREDQALFNNPMHIARTTILSERTPGFRMSARPDIDFSQGCNAALYRNSARGGKRTLMEAKYAAVTKPAVPPRSLPVHLRDRNLNINGANSTGNGRSSELDPNVILPQTGAAFIRFWTQCYLRWIPSIHIVGGGQSVVYKQQCHLIDEILQLKERLDQLRSSSRAKDVVRRPKRESRLYFTYEENSKNNQELMTSAFPFSITDLSLIGGDRRSFLGTPLDRFLRGQSLMQSDMMPGGGYSEDTYDEVEL